MKCKKCGNTENFSRIVHSKRAEVWDGNEWFSATDEELIYLGSIKCDECGSYKIEAVEE